jgi:hypothetical protein
VNPVTRTRALIYTIISKFYPLVAPIDVSTLPVCEWDDADDFVYLGDAHSIMIGGQATPLKYGSHIGILVANEVRAAGLEVVPIRPGAPIRPAVPTRKESLPARPRRAHKAA